MEEKPLISAHMIVLNAMPNFSTIISFVNMSRQFMKELNSNAPNVSYFHEKKIIIVFKIYFTISRKKIYYFHVFTGGKEYNKRQTLNTHIKHVHDKIRNFACPFCSYCASQGCDLKKHIRRIHKVEYKAENKDLLRSPPTLLQPAQF